MKLPNKNNAFVSQSKLEKYLLSNTHPVGKFKSRFFKSIGFSKGSSQKLKQSILEIAQGQSVKEVVTTKYGKKYIIDGLIKSSSGKVAKIRTVWVIEEDQEKPRFVTAYPV